MAHRCWISLDRVFQSPESPWVSINVALSPPPVGSTRRLWQHSCWGDSWWLYVCHKRSTITEVFGQSYGRTWCKDCCLGCWYLILTTIKSWKTLRDACQAFTSLFAIQDTFVIQMAVNMKIQILMIWLFTTFWLSASANEILLVWLYALFTSHSS